MYKIMAYPNEKHKLEKNILEESILGFPHVLLLEA